MEQARPATLPHYLDWGAGVGPRVLISGFGISRFLDDGRLELDTNAVERAIRPTTLNRKNALFAGGDEGGETWAVLATLIECCKLHQVEAQAYLTDVLTRWVNGHPQSRLAELTPWPGRPQKPPIEPPPTVPG